MSKIKIIRLISFILVFVVCFMIIIWITQDKEAKKSLYSLRYEKRDTIDVIFLGNSHANNAFLATELYGQYGYTAYNYSVMAQTFPFTYYCAEDAIKLQHPRLLVVDLCAATVYSVNYPNMHKSVDNLTFLTRMKCISEIVPKDVQLECYFPFYLYHDRWEHLEVKDFIPGFLRYSPDKNARKGVTLVTDWTICEYPESAIGECVGHEFSKEELYWLNRLENLCDENNVQLLYVVIPYSWPVGKSIESTIEDRKLYHAIGDRVSDNKNVGYLDLFDYLDDMEFDFTTDMQDCSHVNILGAKKVTDYLAKYISENYDIPVSWEIEGVGDAWNSYYSDYVEERDKAMSTVYMEIKRNE